MRRTPAELVGLLLGGLLAPVTGLTSFFRRARTFHPEGQVFRARVEAAVSSGPLAPVAARLEGDALVRLSTALWRGGREWVDALGLAIRFRRSPQVSPDAAPDDQDLLFATIRSPWTTLIAPLSTEPHDFLSNDYYAVSPFAVVGLDFLGKVKWRLVSAGPSFGNGNRAERLASAVEAGTAVFQLEARGLGLRHRWHKVATVRLKEAVAIDQAALRFSPFRTGRGIEPRGFIHALRHATYAASQSLRPAGDGAPSAG